MQTKVSTKGQVVLPGPLRRRLGIRAGDPLEVNVEAGSIVLTPTNKRTLRAKIVADPLTGLPCAHRWDGVSGAKQQGSGRNSGKLPIT